ncbi:MAG TPA: PQQ-dependent catabolism-associated CXXCW motif protein, partial [Verrucomicrobiae bacterium]|nr:PQQ-dependent catabolism-associated CXXCW motif protein [Verrucomicrobiae bacterium]
QHGNFIAGLLLAGLLLGTVGASPARAGGDEESASADSTVPEPAGYRMDEYRAPTPVTLAGGTVLETSGVRQLIGESGVVLIDVLPQQKKPDNLPANTLWMPKKRENIPGSIWLPDVGRGALNAEVEEYYQRNLRELTAGDSSRKIVIYCLADCWMSWNAAKRAIEYGYTSVYWYPGGTDHWTAAGLPTEESQPVPMEGTSSQTN